MSFSPEQIAVLNGPLDKAKVKERTQSGRSLSYIEAWRAIEEANRIFGFDGWTRETVELRQLGAPRKVGETMRVGYSCRVRITVWAGERVVVREGCGFGQGIDRDEGQAHESALKEAESDAMKRALMTFGNPFGLALYDKTQANVAVVPVGPSAAAQYAADQLRQAKTGDEFKHFWTTQKDGLRESLSEDDFAHVVGVMRSEAARFAPLKEAA